MRSKGFICLIVILFFIYPTFTYAHSGRTDSYGGHNKTSNGTYHCHSGRCLEDAWKRAYNDAFPQGQEDGVIGENRYEEHKQNLLNKLENGEVDSDIAEYMIPYLLKAYQTGYEDTYIPSFGEKYGSHIGIGSILLLGGIYLTFKKRIISKLKGNKV